MQTKKENAINRAELSEYKLRDLEQTEALQKELIACGFMASRVVMDDDYNFSVIFYDGVREYRMTRGSWRPELHVDWREYPRYDNVSSHTRGEIYKETHTANRVKVLTAKKVQTLIDQENAYHARMKEENEKAADKVAQFLAQVEALNVPVKYSHELHYDNAMDRTPTKGKITGGYIERGGLEFSFEIGNDGYISKKIRVMYSEDDTLENFMLLSDNKKLLA